LLERRRVSTA
jgi:hypothetical protein